MTHNKNIRIFSLVADIKLPLAEDPSETAECNIGNYLVCTDGKNVYAQDWSLSINNQEDGVNMSLLTIDLNFVLLNHKFFEEIT